MKALVIYDSKFGNTKLLASEISHVLSEYGEVNMVYAPEVDPTIFESVDLLVVGGPTQAHGLSPDMKQLLEDIPSGDKMGGGPSALAFDTRLDWPTWLSGSASSKIAHALEKLGYTLLAPPESFTVKGTSVPELLEGEKDRARAWVRLAVEHIATPAPVAQ